MMQNAKCEIHWLKWGLIFRQLKWCSIGDNSWLEFIGKASSGSYFLNQLLFWALGRPVQFSNQRILLIFKIINDWTKWTLNTWNLKCNTIFRFRIPSMDHNSYLHRCRTSNEHQHSHCMKSVKRKYKCSLQCMWFSCHVLNANSEQPTNGTLFLFSLPGFSSLFRALTFSSIPCFQHYNEPIPFSGYYYLKQSTNTMHCAFAHLK